MRLKAFYKPVLVTLSVWLTAAGLCYAEVSRKDLERVEHQAKVQTEQQKKLQEQAEKITQELKKVNGEMIKAAEMIQNNEETISQMEMRLKDLEADFKQTQQNLLREDENLIKSLSALQSLALKPTEALFAQPLAPVDIIRSAMLLRESVPFLEERADDIRTYLEVLETKRETIKRQVAQIVKQKQLLEREHAQMKVLAQKKARYKTQVAQQSAAAKKKADKLAEQAQDLRDLLGKLEQEKARKAEAEKKRRAEQALAQRQNNEQVQNADLIKFDPAVINEIGRNFLKAKGALSRPARGNVVTHYGQETAKGVSSKGIIIKTRNMAQVISPFDGSVLFAGPFRGYGNLIIIEHGQGYTSLLAGLDSIDCDTGQMLLAGEPVGQMPSQGEARLYMELRKDNHPINPESWIEK